MNDIPTERPTSLTVETQKAIDNYLKDKVRFWSAFLGIANVAVLVGSLIYIFFILPNKMATEAQQASTHSLEKIMEGMRAQVTDFQKELKEQSDLFHAERGRREQAMWWMQRDFTNATARFESLKQALVGLERSIQGAGSSGPVLLDLVTKLQGATNLQDLIREQVKLRLDVATVSSDLTKLKQSLDENLSAVKDGLARLGSNVVLRDTALLLISKASGRALDVSDSGQGQDVQVYQPHGRANQQWMIRAPQ